MASSYKASPALNKCNTYEQWLKELEIWQCFTDIPKAKQAPAIFLTLEGKAREAVLELDVANLSCDDGVKNLTTRLDKLYSKDKAQQAYEAYDDFERFKRPENMPMAEFINEFERLLNKTKLHGCTMSDNILAYRVLKSANLSLPHEQLARATITTLTYDNMTTQLRKIFGDSGKSLNTERESPLVKIEPVLEATAHDEQTEESFYDEQSDVYYGAHSDVYYGANVRGRAPNVPRGNRRLYGRFRMRGQSSLQQRPARYGRNPLDAHGNVTRCSICESVNHWASACPDSSSQATVHVTLFQTNLDDPTHLKTFVAESLSAGILDCGASHTVCGKTWLNCYLESLDVDQAAQVGYDQSSRAFKFGDGQLVRATHSVTFPAFIGDQSVFISSDVVESDIPLLLSKRALQRAKAELNFKDDTVTMLGRTHDLVNTSSGHYAIPLNKSRALVEQPDDRAKIILECKSSTTNTDIAVKLHKQFSHPTSEKLITLLKNGGYSDNKELLKEVVRVSVACPTCQVYKKPSPRPVVGMPLATEFN